MSEADSTIGTTVAFDSRVQAAEFARQVILSTSREFCFFGPIIEPVLFDHNDLLDHFSSLARRHPNTLIRFVITNSRDNARYNPKLIALAQKMSSKIKIHLASRRDQKRDDLFLLNATNAYLYCPISQSFTGRAELKPSAEAKTLKAEFESIWAESTPDINTRRLYI
jgi:hypothetical protein